MDKGILVGIIILGIIVGLSAISLYSSFNEDNYYDFGKFQINKGDLDYISDEVPYSVYRLCEIKSGDCVLVTPIE